MHIAMHHAYQYNLRVCSAADLGKAHRVHNKMWLLCVVQSLIVVTTTLVAWALFNETVASAVALGGGAVAVPNALMAFRFWWAFKTKQVQPTLFFFAEAFKIALTISLLGLTYRYWPGVVWPALVAGLVAAATAPLVMPFVQPHP